MRYLSILLFRCIETQRDYQVCWVHNTLFTQCQHGKQDLQMADDSLRCEKYFIILNDKSRIFFFLGVLGGIPRKYCLSDKEKKKRNRKWATDIKDVNENSSKCRVSHSSSDLHILIVIFLIMYFEIFTLIPHTVLLLHKLSATCWINPPKRRKITEDFKDWHWVVSHLKTKVWKEVCKVPNQDLVVLSSIHLFKHSVAVCRSFDWTSLAPLLTLTVFLHKCL